MGKLEIIGGNRLFHDEVAPGLMRLILPHSPYQTHLSRRVCVSLGHIMVQYKLDRQRAEREHGIRPVCVIQLACGRGGCPHPSAARDNNGVGGCKHHVGM